MAGKKLTRNVVVGGVVYGPEGQQGVVSDVPAGVLKQITNPKAFEEVDEPTPQERIEAAERALEEAREDARKQAEAEAGESAPARRSRAKATAKPDTSGDGSGEANTVPGEQK